MLTVVLDTQIILRGASSVTSSITAKIYAAWNDGRFTLLVSEPIVAEIEDVLGRPEVLRKLRMTPVEAVALIELLRRQSTLVTPAVRIMRSRDPDDDKSSNALRLEAPTTSSALTPTCSASARLRASHSSTRQHSGSP